MKSKAKHSVSDPTIEKLGYGKDVLTYYADDKYCEVQGEFYIDKFGFLHHTHMFEDGEEIEIRVPYWKE